MHLERGVLLAPFTTLKLGGPAARFASIASVGELEEALRDLDTRGERVLLLGGGSNLVVADAGFDGTVLRLVGADADVVAHDEGDHVRVVAWAGATWDRLVERAVMEGWSGVEALSGIPGSVGATPMQNVGAYGQEVSDTITRVKVFDRRDCATRWIDARECAFAYRSSRFRGSDRCAVLDVEFLFKKEQLSSPVRYAELARALDVQEGGRVPLDLARSTILRLRRGKGMVVDPGDPESVSAGSFFTNPIVDESVVARVAKEAGTDPPIFAMTDGLVKLPAAWLIERAGFSKGFTMAGAGISKKHALALVNRGGTTADLLALARTIRRGVHDRFGVTIDPEPILVGVAL